MNKEQLLSIVDYWIDHNEEHGQEFRDCAEGTGEFSTRAASLMQEAATKLDEANELLQKAREALSQVEEGG